jgi:translation initiation factor IF-2
MARKIELPSVITVGDLAKKLDLPVGKFIAGLMKDGVMATVNEQIDADTAQIIGEELGLDVEFTRLEDDKSALTRQPHKKSNNGSASRPPVVAVMGHVDHGKTSLLDRIRGSQVASGEAGGITQHITATQVDHGGRLITFLDTPGHSAFAAIRSHAASLTDLVVLVVAADDGVKPQTLEAIRYAANAGVKILVAINTIATPEANTNLVKQELAEQNLLPEDWGGDTVVVEVSAKTGQGIDKLLDMILLMADVDDLRADNEGLASGLVIESHLEKGRGPIASLLVESGQLTHGSFIVTGGTYAKIRSMKSSSAEEIAVAGPSTPVEISGFKDVPDFGEEFIVVKDEKEARHKVELASREAKQGAAHRDLASSDLIRMINKKRDLSELNVLIKADVQGSLASVVSSLEALNTEEVAISVVDASVGNVTENDVELAKTSGAIIYGFDVEIAAPNRRLAARDGVSVRIYRVIYELIDDAKSELSNLLAPEVIETELGVLEVKAVFKTTKSEIICGGEVKSGKLSTPSLARIRRGEDIVANDLVVNNLKRGPQDTKEVFEGEMCGVELGVKGKLQVEENDLIEFFERKVHERKL